MDNLSDRIRTVVKEEYNNILGTIAYKDNKKACEEYFNGAEEFYGKSE